MNQTSQTLNLLDIPTEAIRKIIGWERAVALWVTLGCTHTMGMTTFSKSH